MNEMLFSVSPNVTLIPREKNVLMRLRLKKASRDSSAKNHATLAGEYEHLFTVGARDVVSYLCEHHKMERPEAKQLLSTIFEVIHKIMLMCLFMYNIYFLICHVFLYLK